MVDYIRLWCYISVVVENNFFDYFSSHPGLVGREAVCRGECVHRTGEERSGTSTLIAVVVNICKPMAGASNIPPLKNERRTKEMAEVARLVGMELRDYVKDGQKKRYCGLYLMYLEDSVQDVVGSKVESMSCPRDVDPNKLELGKLYELCYMIYEVKGQKMARLNDLLLVHEGPVTPKN